MVKRKKGKILKIKPGYNPNCSSGMWALAYVFYGVIAGGVTLALSITSAILIYQKHIKTSLSNNSSEEISEEYESKI